ncbi:sigma factor-like helix-turn-helix DNA-binding protein [Roseofilum acuticapitatum]|uniref:sigma factor-like helix-turn-helix DNA-binding protein n=1 Tax=Roseofilum acuticapitatum TaxID=3082945 RepID=UPI003D2F6949
MKPKEVDILKQRFGWDDGCDKSLQEIGNFYDITRERVRQIENKSLGKLRYLMSAYSKASTDHLRSEGEKPKEIPSTEPPPAPRTPSQSRTTHEVNNSNKTNKTPLPSIHDEVKVERIRVFKCSGFSDNRIISILWKVPQDSPEFYKAKQEYQQLINPTHNLV